MDSRFLIPLIVFGLLMLTGIGPPGRDDSPITIAIVNGRVIDPETGYDRIANVGIRGNGRIAVVTTNKIAAARTIEAAGLVVAPGFIDILSSQSDTGDAYKIADGVTTVISTHGGPLAVREYLAEREKKGALVNFGTVVGHGELRTACGVTDLHRPATPAEVTKMCDAADAAMQQGALGVGFGIEYIPGTSGQEVVELAHVAARHRVNVHAHIRLPHLYDPFQGINEMIVASAVTGARAQVVHIGSMAIRRMKESLALIDDARRRGIDIAADIYPYDAWMTYLQSAIFEPGWQEKYSLTYTDLVWVATGERLTAETFEKYRKQGGLVACHQIAEADIELALKHPAVCVASDGTISDGPANHPRGAGTFCRVLGEYVRNRKVLSLKEALKKMTSMPAQRMERAAPAMATKGRLRGGMDADITVFDPNTVRDRATFAEPRQFSDGVAYVFVNGKLVFDHGKLAESVKPGRGIRGRPSMARQPVARVNLPTPGE